MNFDTWEPVYERILADFSYPRAADEQVRDRLHSLVADEPLYDPDDLDFRGETVAIVGGAATLSGDLNLVRNADVVVATAVAAARLRREGFTVDCLVTDLDGRPETVRELAAEKIPVVVHAHGDNRASITSIVPSLPSEAVVPTTQAEPTALVHNFGGFTDGDRAAFLADVAGAAALLFPGWQFDDPTVGTTKRRKLVWAERLLYWLERRRGDRFAVLEGRRDGIDTAPLPI